MATGIKNIKTGILIIGAGPAGLTAGIYCARAGVDALILEGRGLSRLAIPYTIENYPGFPNIQSTELLGRFREHAVGFGARLVAQEAIAFGFDMEPKFVTTRDTLIEAGAVILATGKPVPRERLIPGEEMFLGQGVSYCATCDGPLFRGRTVVAAGSSEEAVEDISSLQQMGCRVVWVPGKSAKIEEDVLTGLRAKGVEIILQSRIKEISGGTAVENVAVESESGRTDIGASAVFIFREIATGLLYSRAGIDLDHKQCVSVDRSQKTNIPGVFAAGDVTCGGMQVVAAAGEGCVAAIQALAFIRTK